MGTKVMSWFENAAPLPLAHFFPNQFTVLNKCICTNWLKTVLKVYKLLETTVKSVNHII